MRKILLIATAVFFMSSCSMLEGFTYSTEFTTKDGKDTAVVTTKISQDEVRVTVVKAGKIYECGVAKAGSENSVEIKGISLNEITGEIEMNLNGSKVFCKVK